MEQLPQKIPKAERLAEMPEEWRVLREKILNNFESKTDGLNIERVKDFMKERNLPVTDFVFFEEKDIPALKEIFANVRGADSFFVGNRGRYISEINLLFVRREEENEKVNGTIFTEGLLVHELVHSTSQYVQYIKKDDEIFVPRAGFGFKYQQLDGVFFGGLLEEGFADLLRGDYIEQNITNENREKIAKERPNTFDDYGFDVADKYMYFTKNSVGMVSTSIAATALEMLCKKEPKLKEVLIEARSDIKKLREIPKLINAIKPGLYLDIQKCEYSVEDFTRVQNIIKEAINN